MLNSAEYEILPTNKQQFINKYSFFGPVYLSVLAESEIFYAYKYENANNSWHFHFKQQRKLHTQLG